MNWTDDGPKPCLYCWMHAHRLCSGGDCACTHPLHRELSEPNKETSPESESGTGLPTITEGTRDSLIAV